VLDAGTGIRELGLKLDEEGVNRLDLLFSHFQPFVVTALLVRGDATVDVWRTFKPGFDLTPALRSLNGTH